MPIKAELAGSVWPDAVLKTIVLKMDNGKYEVPSLASSTRHVQQNAVSRPKGLTIQARMAPTRARYSLQSTS